MTDLPQRRIARLKSYDYSQNGAYFITICTAHRQPVLSSICRGGPCGRPEIVLTALGEICQGLLPQVETRFDTIIDQSVIMPDHIHIILLLQSETPRAATRAAPTVGTVIGAYKSLVANAWLKSCKEQGKVAPPLWQRGYYDHIIRDEEDYQTKWKYMEENPMKWAEQELLG